MIKNLFLTLAVCGSLSVPAIGLACPRSAPATTLPLGIASTETSSITFTITRAGVFTVRRTLTDAVPATAVSCEVNLEGRYSRKLSYSSTKVLGTKSSLQQIVSFVAKRLPAVKPDKFRRQVIQPTLHVRVRTDCIDKDGISVLSDTTPVVARYVECGASTLPVGMGSFINTLTRKLR